MSDLPALTSRLITCCRPRLLPTPVSCQPSGNVAAFCSSDISSVTLAFAFCLFLAVRRSVVLISLSDSVNLKLCCRLVGEEIIACPCWCSLCPFEKDLSSCDLPRRAELIPSCEVWFLPVPVNRDSPDPLFALPCCMPQIPAPNPEPEERRRHFALSINSANFVTIKVFPYYVPVQ